MARTNNLTNFLTDVASAIKTKTGDSTAIPASQFDTKIANITTGHLDNAEYTEANDDLDDILEGLTPLKIYPPDWSEIGYEDTPTSIINDFNYAKEIQENWDSSITSMNNKYLLNTNLKIFPLVDTSNVLTMNNAFNGSELTDISLINTSNVTSMNNAFRSCKNLISFPLINTSKVTDFGTCFAGCTLLKNFPVLDTSSVIGYGFNNTFSTCDSLSNESLNNILLMCINTKNVYSNLRTLSSVGLTSAQATTCQGLSNYQAFLAAGWTTGY